MAAQGIPVGSQAYNDAMAQFGETKNQAYQGAQNAATLAGNSLQGQLFGQNLAARQQGVGEQFDLGSFANQAQQQGFNQALGSGQFGNQAQAQYFGQLSDQANFANNAALADFERNRAMADFNNQAYGQGFNQTIQAGNFNQQEYQRRLANQLQGRNQDFNELAAFLQGSPVAPTNPTFQPTTQYNPAQAAPDAVGLAAGNYNAANQAYSSILGSIFGAAGKAGAAGIAACWVAREVYGTETNRWMMFRHWLLTRAPGWFVRLYLTYGARFAEWLRDKPLFKRLIRRWMDARIANYA